MTTPQRSTTLPQFVADWILSAEGGFGNDADDAGGATKFGISKRAYPDVDIEELTLQRALAIYHSDYWVPIRGDELPPAVALVLFDGAVNTGVTTAVMRFQSALRRLGMLDVTTDGIMGPRTIGAARLVVSAGLKETLAEALSFRAVYYSEIVTRKPKQSKFLRGWMRRTYLLMARCLELPS